MRSSSSRRRAAFARPLAALAGSGRDRVAAAVLAATALLFGVASLALPLGTLRQPGPGLVPLALACLLLALAAAVARAGRGSPPLRAAGWDDVRPATVILGVCAFAAYALERIGYRATVLVAVALLAGALERKPAGAVALAALGLAFGSYYLFATLLRVPLPVGPFGL
jgi:hypothetical protein